MRAVISAAYPVLIQPFIGNEQDRYYLNGFYVHPGRHGGLRIVATDGVCMGVFHDNDGTWSGKSHEGMIIKLPKPAINILKERVDVKRWLIVESGPGNGQAMIVEGDPNDPHRVLGTFPGVLIDSSYPDYRRVLPSFDKRKFVPQSYAMRYIQTFCKLIDRIEGGRIRVISGEEGGPSLVLTDRDDFFGIVMPVRAGDEARNNYPDFWLKDEEPVETPVEEPKENIEEPVAVCPPRQREVITLTPQNINEI